MNPSLSMFPGAPGPNTASGPGAGAAVTPLQEAIMNRIRPFGLTASDLKDLPPMSPFLPAGLGLVRPEGVPGFPGFPGLQSPFLPTSFESRLPALSASGAFRPMFSLPGEAPILKSFPSAFQPPVTRPEPPLFSPGHNLFPGLRSPGSSSRSSPSPITGLKTDENSNTADSRMLLSSPDSGVTKLGDTEDTERTQKRPRLSAGLYGCPICGQGLTPGELGEHYTQELDFLTKVSLSVLRSPDPRLRARIGGGMGDQAPRNRWESFQRIQRNRQSRIRVKLYRRAGKRPDEILEEENNTAEDDIDIIGGVKDTDADFDDVKKPEVKLNPKRSVYGPDQFTEEDVLAVAQELEKEDPAKPGQEEEPMSGDDDDGSKSDSCQKKRCSQCQGSIRRAVVSLVCWHVHCQKCWLQQLATKKGCSECGQLAKPQDLRKVFL